MAEFKLNKKGRRDSGRRDSSKGSRNRSGSKFNSKQRFSREGRMPDCDAVCASCGIDCKVPFKPTENKPVYCNDCFSNDKKNDSRRSSEKNIVTSEQFQQLDAKLDKILKILERLKNK